MITVFNNVVGGNMDEEPSTFIYLSPSLSNYQPNELFYEKLNFYILFSRYLRLLLIEFALNLCAIHVFVY